MITYTFTLARGHVYLVLDRYVRALHARDIDVDILTDMILQRHTDIGGRDIQTYAVPLHGPKPKKTRH